MKALIETRNTRPERVFLVGVEFKSRRRADSRDSLAELGELAATAGGEVVGDGFQKLDALAPATFIGKGKAEEFAEFCRRQDVDTVIFDDDLSPAQCRNLEKIFNCKILDRTALRQAPDRTGATPASAAAPHPFLGTPVATGGRHRDARRRR